MENPSKIPIRFYSQFWDDDWPNLPEKAQEAVVLFLEKLQSNPDNPDILDKCEVDKKKKEKRFAYNFFEGYAIYWRVVREPPGEFLGIESCKPIRIDVLEVCPTKI
ncbi:MAG: hypothetical protein WAM91_16950 [Candidatus Acidiferrales bacterium]